MPGEAGTGWAARAARIGGEAGRALLSEQKRRDATAATANRARQRDTGQAGAREERTHSRRGRLANEHSAGRCCRDAPDRESNGARQQIGAGDGERGVGNLGAVGAWHVGLDERRGGRRVGSRRHG